MTRWFARLPIHQKLVALALVVTAAALLLSTASLVGLDLLRYRDSTADDTEALARVIAENTAAAVMFEDQEAARTSLSTVRVRSTVRRACLYLPDGSLFAGFARSPEFACPSTQPENVTWRVVAADAPINRNNHAIGRVYLERELAEIGTRIGLASLTGLGMLVLAGTVALFLAHRLHSSVSTPIAQLAALARTLQPDSKATSLPQIAAGEDEVGDLVRAFTEMIRRVHDANARLVESNEMLLRQQSERELLLAREREANRLKDEFLASVSHELRTPLNAIVGWVHVLATTPANEQITARAVASIARNAKAQTRVIEDLVDVSRIVAGKLNIHFDPVDLRDVVDDAIEATRPAAHAKDIALTVSAPGGDFRVNGDRDRLQQVVWNLLSNAIKFTPAGGAVSVSLKAENGMCELSVTDTGAGIAPSFLPHVFDRFRQADGSITREHGGLGLGLAIVKELTELHGGVAVATSAGPGLGATFTVRLRQLSPHQAPDLSPMQIGRKPQAAALAGISILAVDDNADALEVLSASLIIRGAEVRTAWGGEEALREWQRQPAEVLICDLAMPRVDGFDVIRGVRELDRASGRATAAIALTAHASPGYQARTRDAGFDGHISKPFDVEELVQAVLGALERV
jgi:signal transduction histidine kinase/CheY-like chemotaxis protein